MKALRHGLRRDTRSVQVVLTEPAHDGWNSLAVLDLEFPRTWPGWWRAQGSQIQTITSSLVTAPPSEFLIGTVNREAWPPRPAGREGPGGTPRFYGI